MSKRPAVGPPPGSEFEEWQDVFDFAETLNTNGPLARVATEVRELSNPETLAALASTSRNLRAAEKAQVPGPLRSWQAEFDRCSLLGGGPGIKKVIELQHSSDIFRTECVAYLLENGALFRTNAIAWPDGSLPSMYGPPYAERSRMWAQHEPLQSASFAGYTGTLLTQKGEIVVVGRDPAVVDELTRGERVLLEACDWWGGSFVRPSVDDDPFGLAAPYALCTWHHLGNRSVTLPVPLGDGEIPTHMVILSMLDNQNNSICVTIIATGNKLYYTGHKAALGIETPAFSFENVINDVQAIETFTFSDPSDTIKDLASGSTYVAVLSTGGEVRVFGHRVPWRPGPVPPNSFQGCVGLPKTAESISCSRDFMAVVTQTGQLFTCGTDTAPLGRDELAKEFRLVQVTDSVHKAFCTERDGLTIVYGDGTAHHYRTPKAGKPVSDVRWPHMGSCWYLVHDALRRMTVLSLDDKYYAVLCWVRAVLEADGTGQGDRLIDMMQWDVDHAVQDQSVAIHPVVFLRLFAGELPWLALAAHHLVKVCKAIQTVHLRPGQGAKAGVPYWPAVGSPELRDCFHEVAKLVGRKTVQDEVARRVGKTVQELLASLPGAPAQTSVTAKTQLAFRLRIA